MKLKKLSKIQWSLLCFGCLLMTPALFGTGIVGGVVALWLFVLAVMFFVLDMNEKTKKAIDNAKD